MRLGFLFSVGVFLVSSGASACDFKALWDESSEPTIPVEPAPTDPVDFAPTVPTWPDPDDEEPE